MRVLFVSSEAHPLVKTGGLGDVAGALPQALVAEGVDVRLLIPAYRQVLDHLDTVEPLISLGDQLGMGEVRVLQGVSHALPLSIWLVDCPVLFDRPGGPYQDQQGVDWVDNGLRFALFSRVAALLGVTGRLTGWYPDLIHLNDWQSGLVPVWLRQWGASRPATLFTIHNLQYQGLFPKTLMSEIGLPDHFYDMHGLEYHQQLSMLKGGLYYADRLSTVSPTYALEVQSEEMGEGLNGLLSDRREQLVGILNGIDTRIWDPQHDPDIAAPFDKERLDERDRNRAPLLIEMGLPVTEPRVPLFGLVSRLVPQKGVDLLLAALPEVLESGAQLVVLGSGMPLLEQQLRQMQQQWPTQLAVWVGYSEPLAHRLVAGVDVLLVPSRFEPCGLTQMYALRYGALPLVRKTGGLADTVDEQSGFLFEEVSVESLRGAMNQVLDAFQDQAAWRERQQYAMGRALDWSRSAKQYKAVYQQLLPTDTGSMK